jgi:hypothetical protein
MPPSFAKLASKNMHVPVGWVLHSNVRDGHSEMAVALISPMELLLLCPGMNSLIDKRLAVTGLLQVETFLRLVSVHSGPVGLGESRGF